jgi:alpha-methylacyl-CoA racemase
MAGPLTGIRIVEMAGIGPVPFCGMLLADLGAEVVIVDRPPRKTADDITAPGWKGDVTRRGRRSIAIDLKHERGAETVLRLAGRADVLLEGFRPGVMERLGLGPEIARGRDARLVYGRMTGWGQDGPLAQRAGHDIAYIALTGALAAMGRATAPPAPPLNLVGDYGGGAMLLAVGVLAALVERGVSGRGQVVDAAMVDGAALLMAPFFAMRAGGHWRDEREANLLDGGAPYYDTYACADGRFLAVGPLEPEFFGVFLGSIGLDQAMAENHRDRARWPALRAAIAARLRQRTRDEWAALLADTDACAAPVLTMAEAAAHEHIAARGTLVEREGVVQPAPAPRFSRTAASLGSGPAQAGADGRQVLSDYGFEGEEIDELMACGCVVPPR